MTCQVDWLFIYFFLLFRQQQPGAGLDLVRPSWVVELAYSVIVVPLVTEVVGPLGTEVVGPTG